jgi:hypothetical protein
VRVVVVPADFVSTGWRTPTVCARHGETAVTHRRVRFRSLVPGWTYFFLLAPLMMLIIAFATQRRVTAAAWPFCPRCQRLRTTRQAIGYGMLALGVVINIFVFATVEHYEGDSGKFVALFLFAGVLFLAGLRVTVRSSLARTAAGYVASNPSMVEFRRPHPEFVRQITEAKQIAAQHYAQQYASYKPS